IEIGDAAIGDVGLAAVEREAIAVCLGRRLQTGDVGPGGRLGERKGRDLLAFGDGWEVSLLLRVGAEQADRARAEALHREGEIGEAVMARQRLANEREAANIEIVVDAAPSRRDAVT